MALIDDLVTALTVLPGVGPKVLSAWHYICCSVIEAVAFV